MAFKKNIRDNGVKGVHSVCRVEASPGTGSCVRQGKLDRQQATVSASYNKRRGKSAVCIGTWNVRTVHEAGSLENVLKEMSRLKVY